MYSLSGEFDESEIKMMYITTYMDHKKIFIIIYVI